MRILFVDDEWRRMTPYVEELQECGHEVVFETDVDQALAQIRDSEQVFDVAILDISVPPGASFDPDETDGGTRTGLNFYDVLRRLRPKLHVVIFTNVADPTVRDHFQSQDQALCLFIRKRSVLPYQFVEEIENFAKAKA